MGADEGTGTQRRSGGTLPERTCAVTRSLLAPEELLRFVADPTGVIVPDVARRLPGRGVWVRLSRATVAEAVKSKAFARSLKRPVTAPEDLPSTVDALLARRALAALSIANKAGLVVAGHAKVEALIERGEAEVLLQASDGAADGTGRLSRKHLAIARAGGRSGAVTSLFSSDELGLAIGRGNVVHAALSDGGATKAFLSEAERLARYRSGSSENRPLHPAGEAG
jgi:hypothetical protein